MSMIKRYTRIGELYISNKTFKMALKYKNKIITDEKKIYDLFDEERIPIRAQFEITEKCNFNCYYCYAKSLRGQTDLNTKQIKKIIDILEDIGVLFLEVTGGEALARTDFLEILKYINSKNFILALYTNASKLNKNIIDELENGNTMLIHTSLLSPNKDMCDKLTGKKGSFNEIINGINLLKESTLRFKITSMLTNENIKFYDEYQSFCKQLNINIDYGIDVGPTFDGYNKVKNYALKDNELDILKKFFKNKITLNNPKCSAGKSKFAIDNEGNVMPCIKFREKFGNILEKDFYSIWNSHEFDKSLRTQFSMDSKCKNCSKKDYCFYCPGVMKLYEDDSQKCRSAQILYKLCQNS